MWRNLALLACVLVFVTATMSWAGMNSGAKLALDIQARNAKRQCAPSYDSCSDINSTYSSLGYYDVMVVVYEYDNLTGVEYSLTWPSGSAFFCSGFVSCADFLIGGTGGPPMNVAQSWSVPQLAATDTSGVAVGWLKLWSDSLGEIELKYNATTNMRGVTDSLCAYDTISGVFTAVVGQDKGGDDPCE